MIDLNNWDPLTFQELENMNQNDILVYCQKYHKYDSHCIGLTNLDLRKDEHNIFLSLSWRDDRSYTSGCFQKNILYWDPILYGPFKLDDKIHLLSNDKKWIYSLYKRQ
jgi:hypothetical protein